MSRNSLLLSLSFPVLFLLACGKPLLRDVTEFMHYIDDPSNGLICEQTVDKVLFKAQYRPAEYMAARELGAELDAAALEERSTEMRNSFTVSFRIMHRDANADILKANLSPQAYLDRITYMTGPIQQDFYILSGEDTVKCAFSHFERAYNITPYNEILLGFETIPDDGKDKKLLYRDRLFDYGWLSFDFKSKDLKDIPSLNL